jgi:fatty acid synthase subunit alpha
LQSSFGFGQVGGIAVIIHPRYLFASLDPSSYDSYRFRNQRRYQEAYKVMTEMMTSNSLVRIKDGPPYSPELEQPVLMNPMARATFDPKTRSYSYTADLDKVVPFDVANAKTVAEAFASTGSVVGVGIDQGDLYCRPSVLRNILIFYVPSVQS